MAQLADIAKAAVGNGGYTGGREKIKLDELIAKYPDGVSITGFDLISYEGTHFPSFIFAEDDSKYFSGGMALIQMADAWVEARDGDLSAINEELQADPVKIKLEKVTTKNRRTYTRVTICSK